MAAGERNPELQAKLHELDNDFAVSTDIMRNVQIANKDMTDTRFDGRKEISHRKGTAASPLLPDSKPRRDTSPYFLWLYALDIMSIR